MVFEDAVLHDHIMIRMEKAGLPVVLVDHHHAARYGPARTTRACTWESHPPDTGRTGSQRTDTGAGPAAERRPARPRRAGRRREQRTTRKDESARSRLAHQRGPTHADTPD